MLTDYSSRLFDIGGVCVRFGLYFEIFEVLLSSFMIGDLKYISKSSLFCFINSYLSYTCFSVTAKTQVHEETPCDVVFFPDHFS